MKWLINMSKTTEIYWNPLLPVNSHRWMPIDSMEGMAEEVTLAFDEETGDYTRLTRFKPAADASNFGSKSHDYPEEIMIIEGRLYDAAFDRGLKLEITQVGRPVKCADHSRQITDVLCWKCHILFSP